MARKLAWVVLLLGSLLYLMNPGWGVLELIPDNIPLIGNLDESVAVLVLLRSLVELNVIGAGTLDRLLNFKDKYEDRILSRKPPEGK